MKKIGIYDPYFHILGGAERYVLTIAQCLQDSHHVTLFSSDKELAHKAKEKFGINLTNFEIRPWNKQSSNLHFDLKQFDRFFYVTDGSIFLSPAKHNYLIIQTPDHIPQLNIVNSLKLLSWQKIICYSHFMSHIITKRLHKEVQILFVPIQKVEKFKAQKKKWILSVGRFFTHLHNKKQLEMVQFFKELTQEGLKGVTLFLVGSVDPGAEQYLKKVEKMAGEFSIQIKTNLSYDELNHLYDQSMIYWHATGFGEDLEAYPERAEHFGVVTIEAMSHRCVPVVFSGGGQTEIVTNGFDGFVWKTDQELIKYTKELIQNQTMREKIAGNAYNSSQKYSDEKFGQRLHEILET